MTKHTHTHTHTVWKYKTIHRRGGKECVYDFFIHLLFSLKGKTLLLCYLTLLLHYFLSLWNVSQLNLLFKI